MIENIIAIKTSLDNRYTRYYTYKDYVLTVAKRIARLKSTDYLAGIESVGNQRIIIAKNQSTRYM